MLRMILTNQTPLFPVGQCVVTRSISDCCNDSLAFSSFVSNSLSRHIQLNSPDLCKEDQQTNKEALENGNRIFTSYNIPPTLKLAGVHDAKIWIITEADRSLTTVLFPSEY